MKIFGYIYLITNTKTGKVYVGQTVQTVPVRWIQHQSCARCPSDKYDYPLYRAMRKHGIDNFTIRELHQTHSQESLDGLEIIEIALRQSNEKPFGYNLTSGGKSTEHSPEVLARIKASSKGRISWKKGTSKDSPYQPRVKPPKAKRRPWSQESRQRASNSAKGRTSPMKGTHMSSAAKLHLSAMNMGQPGNYVKNYIIRDPQGNDHAVRNLAEFCRERSLKLGNFHRTFGHPTRTVSGYRMIEQLGRVL